MKSTEPVKTFHGFDVRIYMKSGNIVTLHAMEKFSHSRHRVSWKETKLSGETLQFLDPDQIEAVTYTVRDIDESYRYPEDPSTP